MLIFYFSVCAFGFYEDGSTCLPCVNLISGSDGENLIDGDTNTCSSVSFGGRKAVIDHTLGVYGNCTEPEINVRVTMEISATCDELRDAVFMDEPSSGCNYDSSQYVACDVISENQSNGKRVCSLSCKCAESADQCLISIISGMVLTDLRICEIKADKQFG